MLSALSELHSQPPMENRRTDVRDPVSLMVELVDGALGTLTFRARDYSKSGLFLERTDPSTPLPAVGARVHLTIRWPLETEIPPIEVEADIIREEDNGVGVRLILQTD